MQSVAKDRVLVDIETQRDFFCPGGSCYSPRSLGVLKQIYRLFNWAREWEIPVLSTVLRVRRHERGPLAETPHCIEGTWGEGKLPRTALPERINLGIRLTTDLPYNILDHYRQVIIEKRDTDLFAHPRAERLITELPATTMVLCGAGVAKSISQAAIGLRARGFGVILAEDAVLDLDDRQAAMARMRMEAKGVVFAPTSEIVAPRPSRRPVPLRQAASLHRVEKT